MVANLPIMQFFVVVVVVINDFYMKVIFILSHMYNVLTAFQDTMVSLSHNL